MHYVNSRNLPGSGASRKLEGGGHVPPGVSFLVEHHNPGDGPRLHRHRCDETFSITEGRILTRAGDEPFEGGPGDMRSPRPASRTVSSTSARATPG